MGAKNINIEKTETIESSLPLSTEQSSLIKSANEEQLLTAAAQPQKIETDRSLNFVKKELEIDFAADDEKHEFQADGAGIVETGKSKTEDINRNQNTEEVEKDVKNNESQSPNQSGIKRRACVRNLKLGGIQNTDSNTQAIKDTEEKVLQETAKSLEIKAAKPNKEEITSSKLIVEPEVGDPRANLPAQSDMKNNTKEVSSTSSGAKNVDISSKSGLKLRKLDPKSKDP